jgi:dipeptidyl aminopeptidase/acylaminoacyl peptidase
MQDDVTDGVNALIKDGTINPNRICIVGASYGGYAALAGGAFTPDLYKCVVSIAGVSDIPLMMEQEEKDHESDSGIYRYWVRQLGDPSIPAELEQMKAASPAMHADKFKVPVLLIHGDKDDVVRIAQSKRMEQAMKAAGKSVEFITIKDEGHHFVAEESDIKVMKEISRFVTTHLGAN